MTHKDGPTEGTWRFDHRRSRHVTSDSGHSVCTMHRGKKAKHNGHVVAAAPDALITTALLLSDIRRLQQGEPVPDIDDHIRQAEAAITKAKGKTPPMSKYFDFKSSASRQQFWGVMVVGHIIFFIVAAILVALAASGPTGEIIGGLGLIVVGVAYVWAMLAACVRRCRDSGLNPWWSAAVLLPYIGYIVLIVIGVWTPITQQAATQQA